MSFEIIFGVRLTPSYVYSKTGDQKCIGLGIGIFYDKPELRILSTDSQILQDSNRDFLHPTKRGEVVFGIVVQEGYRGDTTLLSMEELSYDKQIPAFRKALSGILTPPEIEYAEGFTELFLVDVDEGGIVLT